MDYGPKKEQSSQIAVNNQAIPNKGKSSQTYELQWKGRTTPAADARTEWMRLQEGFGACCRFVISNLRNIVIAGKEISETSPMLAASLFFQSGQDCRSRGYTVTRKHA